MQNCYNTNARQRQQQLQEEPAAGSAQQQQQQQQVETLQFVQQLALQNRELTTELQQLRRQAADRDAEASDALLKMQTIQDRCNQRIDEVTSSLVAKHEQELAAVLQQRLEAEKAWYTEKQKLEAEALKLRHGLRDREQLCRHLEAESASQQQQLEECGRECESLRSAVECLQQERQAARQQLSGREDAAAANQRLRHDLTAANQRAVELQLKIEQLERERLLDAQLEAERQRQLEATEEQSASLQQQLQQLREELLSTRRRLEASEVECRSVEAENASLRSEADSLRSQLSLLGGRQQQQQQQQQPRGSPAPPLDANFREFVAVKRELCALREENQQLRLRLRPAQTAGRKPLKQQ